MNDIDTLLAIEDIRRVEARYARFADGKQWSDMAGLFTPDGTFRTLDVDGSELMSLTGREQIADSIGSRNSGDVTLIHHLLTNEIDIESETEAKGIWSMADLIFRGESAIPAPSPDDKFPPFRTMQGFGHYHVTYRKVDGQWYIATRTQTRTRLEYTY